LVTIIIIRFIIIIVIRVIPEVVIKIIGNFATFFKLFLIMKMDFSQTFQFNMHFSIILISDR